MSADHTSETASQISQVMRSMYFLDNTFSESSIQNYRTPSSICNNILTWYVSETHAVKCKSIIVLITVFAS